MLSGVLEWLLPSFSLFVWHPARVGAVALLFATLARVRLYSAAARRRLALVTACWGLWTVNEAYLTYLWAPRVTAPIRLDVLLWPVGLGAALFGVAIAALPSSRRRPDSSQLSESSQRVDPRADPRES
jgi:hypothetical protein